MWGSGNRIERKSNPEYAHNLRIDAELYCLINYLREFARELIYQRSQASAKTSGGLIIRAEQGCVRLRYICASLRGRARDRN